MSCKTSKENIRDAARVTHVETSRWRRVIHGDVAVMDVPADCYGRANFLQEMAEAVPVNM